MIRDNVFPEEMSKEELDKLHRQARWAAPALLSTGAITYFGNKFVGPKGRKKSYKRMRNTGVAIMAGGAGVAGLNEYLHYKYRKKLKEDDSKKKD